MKLLMIHGINQEDSSEKELLERWSGLIAKNNPALLANVDVKLAYYGKELASWSTGEKVAAVAMGVSDAFDPNDIEEMKFLQQALEETAKLHGLGDKEIDEGTRQGEVAVGKAAVPMGTWFGRRVVGIVRALETVSPLRGAIALKVVKQAYTYLSNPKAGSSVDALVKPHITGPRLVVVSHSLGTVVAFKLLRELDQAGVKIEIPLFVTMGSPLGLEAVKRKLLPPRQRASFVKRWLNVYDPADLVALGRDLDSKTFSANIENLGNINNTTDNAHGITGYLPQNPVLEALRLGLNE